MHHHNQSPNPRLVRPTIKMIGTDGNRRTRTGRLPPFPRPSCKPDGVCGEPYIPWSVQEIGGKSGGGSLDFQTCMATLESVVRQLMKTKRRELFILLCYVAVLVPTAAGQVLCLDCCCAGRIQVEPRVSCCCAEPEPTRPACCTEGRPPAEKSNILAFGRAPCGCVVVPVGKDDPQLAETTNSQPTAPPRVAAVFSSYLGSEGPVISCQAPDHAPADIGKLSTIILLI